MARAAQISQQYPLRPPAQSQRSSCYPALRGSAGVAGGARLRIRASDPDARRLEAQGVKARGQHRNGAGNRDLITDFAARADDIGRLDSDDLIETLDHLRNLLG